MSTALLDPISTTSVGGARLHSAASVHAALADSSDDSYVYFDKAPAIHGGVAFATPAIPSGAVVKQVAVLMRTSASKAGGIGGGPGVAGQASLRNNVIGIPGTQDRLVNWLVPKNIFSYVSTDAEENADADWDLDFKQQGGPTSELRIHRVWLVVTVVPRPVVTVTRPLSPVENTSLPLVTWDVVADADGGDIRQAEVKIFTSAQYTASGFSPGGSSPFAGSGVLTAKSGDVARNWRTDEKLANTTHRAYVRTRQADSDWSSWSYIQFSVNVTPPTNPTSVVPAAEPAEGRIRIDIAGANNPTVDAVELERSLDAGDTWEAVRSFGDPYMGISPVGGEAVIWDWEAPIGVPIVYRARALHAYALGEYAASGWVESTEAQWDSDDWWIKHPNLWELDTPYKIRSQPSHTRVAQQGTFKVLGRADPVVVSGGKRQLPAGEIVFRSLTEAEQAKLDALLEEDAALLIQAPPGAAWPDRWVRLADHTRERLVDAHRPAMLDTLPWQEVARPAGFVGPYPSGEPDVPSHLHLPFTLPVTLT